MKRPEKIARFSSCRGVTFETHLDPFAVPSTTVVVNGGRGSNRFWLPWNQGVSFRLRLRIPLGGV